MGGSVSAYLSSRFGPDVGRRARASTLLCLGLIGLSAGPALGAQHRSTRVAQQDIAEDNGRQYASPYLSLGHWAYDYIDLLVARGLVRGLPPLVQPYRRIDVANAVLAAEAEGQLSREEMEWVAAIKRELADEVELLKDGRPQEVSFHAEAGVGVKALSHTHRDPLRPEGDENLFPTLKLYLYGAAPLVAGVVGGRWDNHLLNDPQFPGGQTIEFRACDPFVDQCAYRPEEAYIELQLPYARLFFGRTYRNWGLPGMQGLLISDYAYSYDHIGYRFGSDRISLSGLYAPFSDFAGDTARHFASHRFDWLVTDNLLISGSESVVFGGENRRIEFNLINPVTVWEISGGGEGRERNAFGLLELWWRIYDDLVTYGAFLVDNTSVGDEEEGKESGFNQYAAAFSLQLPTVGSNLSLRGDFTVVSSLAYRSRIDFFEFYTLDNIGLASDRTDAVVVSLQADWFPRPRLALKPRLDLMWKGEDDITDPWPADAFTGHDPLLVGTIEKTIRPSIGGRWHNSWAELRWDLGANLVKNEGNVARDWGLKGVGRIELELRRMF